MGKQKNTVIKEKQIECPHCRHNIVVKIYGIKDCPIKHTGYCLWCGSSFEYIEKKNHFRVIDFWEPFAKEYSELYNG